MPWQPYAAVRSMLPSRHVSGIRVLGREGVADEDCTPIIGRGRTEISGEAAASAYAHELVELKDM
jgi:hypothetical protein